MKLTSETRVITQQDLGDAIVFYIGQKGGFFATFNIISSSLDNFSKEISVELSPDNLDDKIIEVEKIRPAYDKMSIILTRYEIFQAITIGMNIKIGKPFKGNRVKSLSIELPEEVTVTLGYIPRGSFTKDYSHKF